MPRGRLIDVPPGTVPKMSRKRKADMTREEYFANILYWREYGRRYRSVEARRDRVDRGTPSRIERARFDEKVRELMTEAHDRAALAASMDLSSRVFGDPPPGRSALDQKRRNEWAS